MENRKINTNLKYIFFKSILMAVKYTALWWTPVFPDNVSI